MTNTSTSMLHRAVVDSPVGPLTIVASERGLRALLWMGEEDSRVRVGPSSDTDDPHGMIAATAAQLEEYFAGTRTEFDLPLDPIGTDFQQSAWMALRTIPFGETVSYGEQARRLGDQRKARAVGAANGRNPISIIVPCHRVVGADGSLTGFGGGIENKAWLLDHERAVWSGMIVS
ncbi:MAG: ogt [Ilumatobacteraceae bacterium]|nr:ogt [Ilumatobacteraceae bacterium]